MRGRVPARSLGALRLALVPLLCIAASVLVAPAGAQGAPEVRPASAPLGGAPDPRLAEALDPETRDSLVAAITEARRRRLPAGPLVAKALEGVEKGAPAPRIQGALRKMLLRLQAARDGLAPVVSEAELVAGADALAAGVPQPALRELRKKSPGRSTATALGVLAQLVSRGVPADKAQATVMLLLARGGSNQQLLTLERSVNGDIALGLSPDAALEMNSKAIIPALPVAPAGGAVGAAATTGDATNLSTTSKTRP